MYIPLIAKTRYRETGLGPAIERDRPSCHQRTWYGFTRARRMMIVLMIFPVPEWTRYFLNCWGCKAGARVGDDLIPVVQEAIQSTRDWQAGAITPEAYAARIADPASRINAAMDAAEAVSPAVTPTPPAAAQDAATELPPPGVVTSF